MDSTLVQELRGTVDDGYVLLRLGDGPTDIADLRAAFHTHGAPLNVHDLPDPTILELYERRLVLVRPDGHVAWRADRLPADADGLVNQVRGAMALQPSELAH